MVETEEGGSDCPWIWCDVYPMLRESSLSVCVTLFVIILHHAVMHANSYGAIPVDLKTTTILEDREL